MVYYDVFMNILNRWVFLDVFVKFLNFVKCNGYVMLIGIVDVDYFKIINDSYGYGFGDDVLIIVV